MKTTENNKLLAEFLEWSKKGNETNTYFKTPFKSRTNAFHFHISKLRFHKDWNWLMLVVEKIETVETKDGRTFTVDMHRDNVIINQYGKYNNEIIVTGGGTRIENLYNACIEFVKWYNKEQSGNAVINSLDEWAKSGFAGIETMFGGK